MRILLFGDYITDHYIFGSVSRVCPEAPVPVFVPDGKDYVLEGGAALVAKNLKALGVSVAFVHSDVSTKTRYFCGKHLLMRVDADSAGAPIPLKDMSANLLFAGQSGIDAIVVSDYGKGAMTKELADLICQSGIPTFVDAKKNWHWYAGASAAFPNKHESVPPNYYRHVIQKLGEKGCLVDGTPVPARPRQVFDVTGAGDVFLAAFVVRYLETKDLIQAAEFANECAGESVEHLGGYVLKSRVPVCS